MNRRLILVRHAAPDVTPGLAAQFWPLSERGKEDCVLLAHSLPETFSEHIFASAEPKAAGTAAVIALRRGGQVVTDPGFGEVDRPAEWVEDYDTLARSYLQGADIAGWEPRSHVVARFDAAVQRAVAAAPSGDTVICNHGLALTLYAASLVKIDAPAVWQSLTMPDAWLLDPESRSLSRLHESGVRR